MDFFSNILGQGGKNANPSIQQGGTSQFEAGNYSEAVKSFEKALKIEPENGFARLYMGGRALACLGRDGEAAEWLKKAIESAPDDAGTLRVLGGHVLARTGEYEEAAGGCFAQIVEGEPADTNASYWHGGEMLERLGRYAEAASAYTRALAGGDPENIVLRERCGRMFERAGGDYREAAACFEKVLRTNPGSTDLLARIGAAYLYQALTRKPPVCSTGHSIRNRGGTSTRSTARPGRSSISAGSRRPPTAAARSLPSSPKTSPPPGITAARCSSAQESTEKRWSASRKSPSRTRITSRCATPWGWSMTLSAATSGQSRASTIS